MESNGAGLEQRLSSLQTQIDDLRQAATLDEVLPLEQRLSTLTDYTSGILKRWAATADRHARAVTQLETHLRDLGDAGNRLHQDASQRLQDLERIVQQEWTALRDIHEAPVRQLMEQASALTEVCIATANSAQHGFDRAEARLATLEADFQRTASELTREVQTLVAEVRQLATAGPRQLVTETPSWPLEGVTRLHHQLRESAADPVPALPPPAVIEDGETGPEPIWQGQSMPDDHVEPPFVAASAMAAPPLTEPRPAGASRLLVVGALVTILLAGALFTWRLQRDIRTAAQQAEQSQVRAQNAETASRQAAEKQAAADRQLLAARDLATRAQTIGDVLAAPDLVRYTLTNPASLPGVSGQVLWSRSRGFVFSASGLPAPPADTTYQVWLLTRGGAVGAATFVPDAAGRVTVSTTPEVARPVFGAIVTTEPTGGSRTPSGEPVLARVPVAPAPS